MNTIFWFNNPLILLENVSEVFPTKKMNSNEKLNAISRLVIILSCVGYIFTCSLSYLLMGLITLILIIIIYRNKDELLGEGITNEGYTNFNSKYHSKKLTDHTLNKELKTTFYKNSKENPLGNVLLTEIGDNPNRLSAQPTFNIKTSENITKDVKKMVQMLNPELENTNKQLYGDLWENFELDQSNRIFYSTANTRVTNDQGAFADLLYGTMPSGKDGDKFQLLADSFRYILQ